MRYNPRASRSADLLLTSDLPLQEQVEILRETVRVYQEALTPTFALPAAWGLTASQDRLLCTLRAASPGYLSIERAMLAMFGCDEDVPDIGIISQQLNRLRSKLRKNAVAIEVQTVWARGWRMTAESCARFDAAVAADRAASRAPPPPLSAKPRPPTPRFSLPPCL